MQMGAVIGGCAMLMLPAMFVTSRCRRILMPVVTTKLLRIVMHRRVSHTFVMDYAVTRFANQGFGGSTGDGKEQ